MLFAVASKVGRITPNTIDVLNRWLARLSRLLLLLVVCILPLPLIVDSNLPNLGISSCLMTSLGSPLVHLLLNSGNIIDHPSPSGHLRVGALVPIHIVVAPI